MAPLLTETNKRKRKRRRKGGESSSTGVDTPGSHGLSKTRVRSQHDNSQAPGAHMIFLSILFLALNLYRHGSYFELYTTGTLFK
jgi:hypothetical protein